MGFPVLHAQDRNLAVRAMQNALHRALHAKDLPHLNNRSGAYGSNTVKDIAAFKEAYKLRSDDGLIFGHSAWEKLRPFMGLIDRTYVSRYNAKLAAKRAKAKAAKLLAAKRRAELAAGVRVADAAERAYHEGGFVYRQIRPMADSLFSWLAKSRTDCSSLATLSAKAGKIPDPNRFGYNGYGFTGTMDARADYGEWVDDPQPGDFAFYGPNRWNTTHMAVIAKKSANVVSLGSTPIKYLPRFYRFDCVGFKRFPKEG